MSALPAVLYHIDRKPVKAGPFLRTNALLNSKTSDVWRLRENIYLAALDEIVLCVVLVHAVDQGRGAKGVTCIKRGQRLLIKE